MLYRISQQTLFRTINTNLSQLSWQMAQATNQLSTGKKVNKPSDDPSGGAAILAMRTILADIQQYNKDVALADDWLKQTESVLQNMKNTVQQANISAEQMSTDTYRDENMDVAAEEINRLFDSLIKMGNTRIGDRYLFAGQRTEVQPFSSNLTILNPMPDSGNSSSFTGNLVTQGSRIFNSRPDIPSQTQKFLVEVTSPGGIDVGGNTYSLARATLDPSGDHNGLFYEAAPGGGWTGDNGNDISIQYVASAGAAAPSVAVAGSAITVFLAMSAGSVVTTASEVMTLINNDASASSMVTVSLMPGNSGSGKLNDAGPIPLSGGYDQAAKFRVSQDGGLTWSVQDAFDASGSRGNDLIYNPQLGHAVLTTDTYGAGNDIQILADHLGTYGNNIQVQFMDDPNSALSVDVAGPESNSGGNWIITVHLETSAALGGAVVTTADDVMSAINHHASASGLVTVSLADYREGGNGTVKAMRLTNLAGGDNDTTALGYASLATSQTFTPPSVNPNVEFTALTHGPDGNDIQVQFVSGGAGVPTYVTTPPVPANVVTVNLETDSSGRSVATGKDVVDAIERAYLQNPQSALVYANLVDFADGGDSVIEPMTLTSLAGGDDSLDQADYGINIRFDNDGSPLSVGDRFEVEVSYYLGDNNALNLNVNQETRVKSNVDGEDALGETGSRDNILDTLKRLEYALRQHDSTKVGEELPRLDAALEKLTTNMSMVGVRLTRNQFIANSLDASKESSTARMSRFEDLDFEEAITRLQTTQTAYQATLASTSMVTQLSLVDYIK